VANNNFETKSLFNPKKKRSLWWFFSWIIPEKLHLYLEDVWDVVAVTFQSVFHSKIH